MPCIDTDTDIDTDIDPETGIDTGIDTLARRDRMNLVWCAGLALIAGCSAPAPTPIARPASPSATSSGASTSSAAGAGSGNAAPVAQTAPSGSASNALPLAPPSTQRNWDAVRRQAALRMVAASPTQSYSGTPPEILLAIPVLEVELNGDGSVRRIDVLRRPSQALDTVQLAMDAVRRGAPYGDVSRLPRPWKFVETFLFDDARRFKPRTLDL